MQQQHLREFCYQYNAGFIHFSTDYVFDGNGNKPYQENDAVNPVSVYGASKLEGEKLVMQEDPNAVIIRTSWVFSSYGKNFVKTMIRLMQEKEQIKVVNDQFGCPTYAGDLATVVLTMICSEKGLVPGIYHYCNEGITNWFSFASEIKNQINSPCEILPIDTSGYPTPAKRPAYSVLDCTKDKNHLFNRYSRLAG
ncbi:MAG: dTDP-4-dehydrorhamnose reductase [Ferruginibacter sp.]